ncbi:O-antigen ligase family protein [Paenibacillus nasutitermitis]|uniref:O-antigen ligase-related domain-containing protein n=1 Tax=Paenibacillus nasutitermitis TaxID=1652958 RepID=A0A916Z4A5_9BACL|nr:O-antigen ligase family protein [Paenibacillus nasutitermitis]GGD75739.1 hypothetical protein GCM10010911_37180 [Paenibacillus nasutitermitis]
MAVIAGAAGLLFTGLMILSAFRYGMFFDENFYRWEWILMAATVISGWVTGYLKLRQQRRYEHEIQAGAGLWTGWFHVPPEAYAPLALAFLYGCSLLNGPASVLATVEQALRWSAYTAFLISGYMWLRIDGFRSWLLFALQASGIFLMGGALAAWLGWIEFPEMFMITGDSSLSAVGARLAGFIQYPNALGAIAGAYLLWNLLLAIRAGNYRAFLITAVLMVPLALVLLLTESRAAWLTTAAGWLAGLVLANREQRVKWLIYTGWMLIGTGAAYRLVVGAGPHGNQAVVVHTEETLWLLVILLVSAAGFSLLRTGLAGSAGRKLEIAAWSGLGAAFLVMALLLPAVIQGRLSGQFQTAGARTMFYKDAWSLFLDTPLFGRGGDTWRMLFTQIQTYPYIGNEVHSGYLELLLNLGAAGLIIFLIMLILLLRRVWKNDRAGLLPAGVLLAHAAVDFDMSFGYYWLLLFAWIIYYSPKVAEQASGSGRDPGEEPLLHSSPAVKALKKPAPGWRALLGLATVLVFAAASLYSWRFDKSVQHRMDAVEAAEGQQISLLEQALAANPYWSRVRIELSLLVPPNEGLEQLKKGLRYEPQSVPLLSALGRTYAQLGDVAQTADYFRLALAYDHYDRGNQTGAIVVMAGLARDKQAEGQVDESLHAAQTALAFFAAFKDQGIAARLGGREFEVTPESQEAADDMLVLLDELQAGETEAGKQEGK